MRWLAVGLAMLLACERQEGPSGYQGVIELDERVLSFEIAGRITSLRTARGAQVKPEDVIATLDDSQSRAAIVIREAEAKAARERANLVAAGGRTEDIRVLEAQLRAARAAEQLAVKRHTDDQRLVGQGALPLSVADESAARKAAATAERQALEQRLRELRTGARREEIAGAKAQASAADAVVELENDRASRYQLRARHAGEVLDVHVESDEVVGAGTPIVTVGDTAHPYVDVFVPQRSIAGVRVGARASIVVDSIATPFTGAVEHVSRRTEFTPRYIFNPRERANLVVRTRIRIDDPQRALHAGTPAFVTISN